MLNALGIRLATANSIEPKAWLSCQCHQFTLVGKEVIAFWHTVKPWLIEIHKGWMEFSIRVLILFHSSLTTWFYLFIFFSKCVYPLSRLREAASNVWGSIQMERRYGRQSWMWPNHRSSLGKWFKKKINSLQNSSFLVLLMLSHQCGVVRRDNSVSWDTG